MARGIYGAMVPLLRSILDLHNFDTASRALCLPPIASVLDITSPEGRHGRRAMSNERDMIAQQRARWTAAVNATDLDQYAALVTEDLVWFPPGQPAISGKKAFVEWLRPFFENFEYAFSLHAPQVQLAGGWAIERGRFQSQMRSRGGGMPGQHSGMYLVVWRKDVDNAWRIERYIDTTGIP